VLIRGSGRRVSSLKVSAGGFKEGREDGEAVTLTGILGVEVGWGVSKLPELKMRCSSEWIDGRLGGAGTSG
jgi:hypothetical protein